MALLVSAGFSWNAQSDMFDVLLLLFCIHTSSDVTIRPESIRCNKIWRALATGGQAFITMRSWRKDIYLHACEKGNDVTSDGSEKGWYDTPPTPTFKPIFWTSAYFSTVYLFLLSADGILEAARGFEVLDTLLIFGVVFWYVEHFKPVQ